MLTYFYHISKSWYSKLVINNASTSFLFWTYRCHCKKSVHRYVQTASVKKRHRSKAKSFSGTPRRLKTIHSLREANVIIWRGRGCDRNCRGIRQDGTPPPTLWNVTHKLQVKQKRRHVIRCRNQQRRVNIPAARKWCRSLIFNTFCLNFVYTTRLCCRPSTNFIHCKMIV